MGSLAEDLRAAAETGTAGTLLCAPGFPLSGPLDEFRGVGSHQRPGLGPAGVTITLVRSVTRYQAELSTRRERETFDGPEPAAMTWLTTMARDLREAPLTAGLPLLVLLTPGSVSPSREMAEALTRLAREQRCCVAVLAEVPGYLPGLRFVPKLGARAAAGEVAAAEPLPKPVTARPDVGSGSRACRSS